MELLVQHSGRNYQVIIYCIYARMIPTGIISYNMKVAGQSAMLRRKDIDSRWMSGKLFDELCTKIVYEIKKIRQKRIHNPLIIFLKKTKHLPKQNQ